jgi:hypothetical protein
MWTLIVMRFVVTGAFMTYEVATYKNYDDCITNLYSVRLQLKSQETLEHQFVVACKNFDTL